MADRMQIAPPSRRMASGDADGGTPPFDSAAILPAPYDTALESRAESPLVTVEDPSERVAMRPFGSSLKVSTVVPDGVPIELNRWVNATPEAMAQALFRSWFVDFDPVRAKIGGHAIGLSRESANLFPDRLVNSEVGEIPEGWPLMPLPEFVSSRMLARMPRTHEHGTTDESGPATSGGREVTDTLLGAGDRKEALSRVYARAVAAAAGYVVGECDFDRDGVDLRIHAGGEMRPALDLQLKATVKLSDRVGGYRRFALKRRNYDLLSEGVQTPRLLVVVDLP